MAQFDLHDDGVVVIVRSGAGGGTLVPGLSSCITAPKSSATRRCIRAAWRSTRCRATTGGQCQRLGFSFQGCKTGAKWSTPYSELPKAMATASEPAPDARPTHNLCTNRMSARPEDGVTDAYRRAHNVPNLYVSGGSLVTTGAAENRTLTIVALASREAWHIAAEMGRGRL